MKKLKEFISDSWRFILILVIYFIVITVIPREIMDYIELVVGGIMLVLAAALIIFLIYLKIIGKKYLKLVDKKDLLLVEKYYKSGLFEKLDEEKEEIELYDFLATISDISRSFMQMRKKLGYSKEEFLNEVDEFSKIVEKINSKKIDKFYKETLEVVNVIYKYYDDNGIRTL